MRAAKCPVRASDANGARTPTLEVDVPTQSICSFCGSTFRHDFSPRRRFCTLAHAYAFRRTPTAPIEVSPDGSARVPLHDRHGTLKGYATIDAADAKQIGRWAWRLNSGYAVRCETVDGREFSVKMHRVLLDLVPGDGLEADHIDHDTLNNRRGNLRVLTHDEQMQNRRSFAGASSRFRGVSWFKESGKWMAYVSVKGKRTHLGLFTDEQEAAEVARAARARLMPVAVD